MKAFEAEDEGFGFGCLVLMSTATTSDTIATLAATTTTTTILVWLADAATDYSTSQPDCLLAYAEYTSLVSEVPMRYNKLRSGDFQNLWCPVDMKA